MAKQRQFTHEDPKIEARLNVLFARIGWIYRFYEPCTRWGIVWSALYAVSSLVTGQMVTGYAALTMTAVCWAAWYGGGIYCNWIEREWDENCPCPVCVSKRQGR